MISGKLNTIIGEIEQIETQLEEKRIKNNSEQKNPTVKRVESDLLVSENEFEKPTSRKLIDNFDKYADNSKFEKLDQDLQDYIHEQRNTFSVNGKLIRYSYFNEDEKENNQKPSNDQTLVTSIQFIRGALLLVEFAKDGTVFESKNTDKKENKKTPITKQEAKTKIIALLEKILKNNQPNPNEIELSLTEILGVSPSTIRVYADLNTVGVEEPFIYSKKTKNNGQTVYTVISPTKTESQILDALTDENKQNLMFNQKHVTYPGNSHIEYLKRNKLKIKEIGASLPPSLRITGKGNEKIYERFVTKEAKETSQNNFKKQIIISIDNEFLTTVVNNKLKDLGIEQKENKTQTEFKNNNYELIHYKKSKFSGTPSAFKIPIEKEGAEKLRDDFAERAVKADILMRLEEAIHAYMEKYGELINEGEVVELNMLTMRLLSPFFSDLIKPLVVFEDDNRQFLEDEEKAINKAQTMLDEMLSHGNITVSYGNKIIHFKPILRHINNPINKDSKTAITRGRDIEDSNQLIESTTALITRFKNKLSEGNEKNEVQGLIHYIDKSILKSSNLWSWFIDYLPPPDISNITKKLRDGEYSNLNLSRMAQNELAEKMEAAVFLKQTNHRTLFGRLSDFFNKWGNKPNGNYGLLGFAFQLTFKILSNLSWGLDKIINFYFKRKTWRQFRSNNKILKAVADEICADDTTKGCKSARDRTSVEQACDDAIRENFHKKVSDYKGDAPHRDEKSGIYGDMKEELRDNLLVKANGDKTSHTIKFNDVAKECEQLTSAGNLQIMKDNEKYSKYKIGNDGTTPRLNISPSAKKALKYLGILVLIAAVILLNVYTLGGATFVPAAIAAISGAAMPAWIASILTGAMTGAMTALTTAANFIATIGSLGAATTGGAYAFGTFVLLAGADFLHKIHKNLILPVIEKHPIAKFIYSAIIKSAFVFAALFSGGLPLLGTAILVASPVTGFLIQVGLIEVGSQNKTKTEPPSSNPVANIDVDHKKSTQNPKENSDLTNPSTTTTHQLLSTASTSTISTSTTSTSTTSTSTTSTSTTSTSTTSTSTNSTSTNRTSPSKIYRPPSTNTLTKPLSDLKTLKKSVSWLNFFSHETKSLPRSKSFPPSPKLRRGE